MARIYIAHKYQGDKKNIEKVGEIARKLQIEHPENSYFSPLHNFSFLDYEDIDYEQMLEICLDWLNECDRLIVASDLSKGVCKEIDFANLVGMEVEYLEDTEKY